MLEASMYAQYLRERTSDSILETSIGFATYRHLSRENATYIMDIYVLPKFRHQGRASEMADVIAEEARKLGHTRLIGSVIPSTKGSTQSVQVLIAYGMSVKSAGADFIVFEKSI